MTDYPINLRIGGKRCLVVGGGSVACRKVKSLLAAEAQVTVLSPELTAELAEMQRKKQFNYIAKPYQEGDLGGFFLVICATDDPFVNEAVAREAEEDGILANVVDVPELGNFSVPAQVKRGDLLLTVSTGGKSPVLAKRLRQQLAAGYGGEYGEFLDFLNEVRGELKQRLATSKERECFWREAINEDILALLRQGRIEEAEAMIRHAASSIGIKS